MINYLLLTYVFSRRVYSVELPVETLGFQLVSSHSRMTSTQQRGIDSLLCSWDGTEKKKPKVRGVMPACAALSVSPLPHVGHVFLISGMWNSMTQSRLECGVS